MHCLANICLMIKAIPSTSKHQGLETVVVQWIWSTPIYSGISFDPKEFTVRAFKFWLMVSVARSSKLLVGIVGQL